MTIKDIQKELNVSENTIYGHIKIGIKRNGKIIKLAAHKEIWRGCQMRWVITKDSFLTFKKIYYGM